jgi:hypothetical protein
MPSGGGRKTQKPSATANSKTALPAERKDNRASVGTSKNLQDPVRTAVDTAFRNNETLRAGLTANLRKHSAASQVFAQRAQKAFADFVPSRHSKGELQQPTFVVRGEKVTESQISLFSKRVEVIHQSPPKRSIRLVSTDALKQFVKQTKSDDGSTTSTVDLSKLVYFINGKVSGPRLVARQSAFTNCKAQQDAARRIQQAIQDATNGVAPKGSSNGVNGAKDSAPPDNTPVPAPKDEPEKLTADQVVQDNVALQMKTATSPETQLAYAIPSLSQKQGDVQSFELRTGPTDTVAYHDFYSLQIAFESIWEELIDPQVTALGKQLYEEYVKVKDFVGADDGTDGSFSTLSDLQNLMAEIRSFTVAATDGMPTQFLGDQPTNSTVDGVVSQVDLAMQYASNPAKAASDFVSAAENGFVNKEFINWSDFPGPLPGYGDQITYEIKSGVAPAGIVLLALALGPNVTSWKGAQFIWIDTQNNDLKLQFLEVENDQAGTIGKADPNTGRITSVAPLPLGFVSNSALEFQLRGTFGSHPSYYRLLNFGQKLKAGDQVTFTWTQPAG